jgi:hypothetical protein
VLQDARWPEIDPPHYIFAVRLCCRKDAPMSNIPYKYFGLLVATLTGLLLSCESVPPASGQVASVLRTDFSAG